MGTNLTRDAFLMVCKKCSKNILKSRKITSRLNSFSSILIKTRCVMIRNATGNSEDPVPGVLVVFATPRFPGEEYDLVFTEVPTTPRFPEQDLLSKVFLFCSKMMH